MRPAAGLSRRQRQIMDILYQRGKSSAADVKAAMADAPSYSGVRAMLRVLEDKGYVQAPGGRIALCLFPDRAPGKSQAVGGKAPTGYILQEFPGADRGGAPGRVLHTPDTPGSRLHGGDDRKSKEGGQVNVRLG